MFHRAKSASEINLGDRFVKTDDPRTVWIVTGRGSAVSKIPHYQVVREGMETRRRTLSATTLLDPDYYRRVSR